MAFPEEKAFVTLDGLSLKVIREGEGIVRESVYVALGIAPNGERRVLGFWRLPATWKRTSITRSDLRCTGYRLCTA